MPSRRWGLIAIVALVISAVLLGVAWIWQQGPEVTSPASPTARRGESTAPSVPLLATRPRTSPVTYTVRQGDTLSAIAQAHDVGLEELIAANDLSDPDVLQVGQILLIPHDAEGASSGPAPTESLLSDPSEEQQIVVVPPTMTPSGPSLVEVDEVASAGDLQAETLVLSNKGGVVDLEAWTLATSTEQRFIFPALTLFAGGRIRVHSREGDNTPRDLYWGRIEPAWQEGDLVTLRDADGNVVDTHIVEE